MFCSNCGNTIPGGSRVCPYCGKSVAGMGGAYQGQCARINNIFTALMQEKTPGAVWEFALWCTVCVCVLLSIIALFTVNSWMGEITAFCRLVWLFVMLFEIGTGVLMVFRLKPIMLYTSSQAIQVTMSTFLYALYAFIYMEVRDEVPIGMILMYVFLLLVSIGLTVCSSIHFFTKINLGKVSAILDVIVAGLMLIFAMVLGVSMSAIDSWVAGNTGFGLGITSLVLMNAVLAVFYMLFFFGCIDNRRDKIIRWGGRTGNPPVNHMAFTPGLQCIRGQYQGQIMYLRGYDLTFGSQPGEAAVVIPDPYISRRHCSIRYDSRAGMYGIMDVSTNGVYLTNLNGSTQRIPSGQYISCPRGSVISLGSMEQQFRLL